MALARWDPTRDLLSVREQVNRLFNELSGRLGGQEGTWSAGAWAPPVDIYETADALVLKAELPGVSAHDINIELKENTLILRGERKPEAEVREDHYHRTERTYGTFQRSFVLPTIIDQEKVRASYRDGVLELRLPKQETAKPRQITIASYPP